MFNQNYKNRNILSIKKIYLFSNNVFIIICNLQRVFFFIYLRIFFNLRILQMILLFSLIYNVVCDILFV